MPSKYLKYRINVAKIEGRRAKIVFFWPADKILCSFSQALCHQLHKSRKEQSQTNKNLVATGGDMPLYYLTRL
jgi:hypothetical protein